MVKSWSSYYLPVSDVDQFDVLKVPLEGYPEKVTAVVLDRMLDKNRKLFSFDVFPIVPVAPSEVVEKQSSFAIYSEGYKEQMGLPLSEDFKIDFMPVTLMIGDIDNVEKIGYVGMRNAKEVMLNELGKRIYSQNDPANQSPLELTVSSVFGVTKNAEADASSEIPTLSELVERGELSEYTRWVFSGEKEGMEIGPVLDKKGKPIMDTDQKPVTIHNLHDLYNFISIKKGPADIAKSVKSMGSVSAEKAVAEVEKLIEIYPR